MIKGGVITFSGVDGAGKTTILREFAQLLENEYEVEVVEFRQRPSFLPILSSFRYGKKTAEQKATFDPPRIGTNSSRVSSYIRFFYYLADYLLGQWLVRWKYRSKKFVILYDRYFFDYIADPKRANIIINQSFALFCYRFVFKPEVNIFLYASPEVVLSRKQELDASAISELTDRYMRLFSNFEKSREEKYLSIENLDKELTIRQIFDTCKEVYEDT